MHLRSALGSVRRHVLSHVHTRPCRIDLSRATVSFCFDDFPRTAFTEGARILQGHGVRGTFYVAMGLMGTENELGPQFLRGDLDSLLALGHELGSHTFGHTSSRSTSAAEFERDVRRGHEALAKETGLEPTSFAYPYGHMTLASKKRLAGIVESCRSIHGGLNGPTVDLSMLRACSLYGDMEKLPEYEALLSRSEQERKWLIFYTHDVRQNPSPFGCTPALLEKVLTRTLEWNCSIATVGQVIARHTHER
jgi:peptidoglycan/xylan/chitin deacetylase (PgdA/CDA1 family)